MLAQQRRDRLLAEMQKAGIDAIIAFWTNWQEAYLRYVSDFCILEGSGVAVLTSDGRCRLMLDSITEAERAQEEATTVEVTFARESSRAVTPSLEPFANQRLAAAPPHLMPAGSLPNDAFAHRGWQRADRPPDDGKISAPRSRRCGVPRHWRTKATRISARRRGRAAPNTSWSPTSKPLLRQRGSPTIS